MADSRDPWAAWLLERRHGGDERTREGLELQLARFRDGVLAGAGVREGDTVLDVGCGEGLIGFGALPLVGEDGSVIFSDVSEELLDVCRARADRDGRCRFVRAAACRCSSRSTATPIPSRKASSRATTCPRCRTWRPSSGRPHAGVGGLRQLLAEPARADARRGDGRGADA